MPDLNADGVIDESERSAYPVPERRGFLPSAADARQTPAESGLVPEEPSIALPPVFETPADAGVVPSLAEPEVEFEEPPAPEPVAQPPALLAAPEPKPIESTSGALMNLGSRLDTMAGQQERLEGRLAALRARYGEAGTEAERTELVERMRPIAGTLEQIQAQQAEARAQASRLADQGQVELEAERAKLEGEIQGAAQQELEATRRKAEAERVNAQDQAQVARARLDEDRAAYRRALEAEPKMRTGAVLAEMVSESINAAVERRQPQFGAILARGRQDARDVYRERAERALALVQFGDDEVARRAAVGAEIDAQQAAAELEILARAEQSLAQQLGQAAAPLEQARLSGQLDALRQERAAREAQAEQARLDADLKRAKAESEVELTRAKIAGERADAAKTEAEIAKLSRRGGGARVETVTPGLLAPHVVTFPDSDQPLVEFPNNDAGRKEASVVRGLVASQSKALDRINTVIALYEDADKRGVLESAGWDRSGDYARLDSELAFLRTDLALVKSGGLATTEGDDNWAGKLVPGSPKAWSSKKKALSELTALRATIENEARTQLSGKTRLDKQTRERIIGASRPKSVSRSDLAKRETEQAAQDLVSPKTSSARKITAIDQVEAAARQEAADAGAEDDWLPRATASLADALAAPAVRGDAQVREEIRARLERYEAFARERETESKRSASKPGAFGVGQVGEQIQGPAKQERARGVAERARLARLKDTIRAMTDKERREWSVLPGVQEVVAEVEAEESARTGTAEKEVE